MTSTPCGSIHRKLPRESRGVSGRPRTVSFNPLSPPMGAGSLMCLSLPGTGTSLVAVDILPGTTFDWGEERTLFDVGDFYRSWPHPFDLTRDDQRFVMIRGVEDRSAVAELIVVRNFSEVLEGLFR